MFDYLLDAFDFIRDVVLSWWPYMLDHIWRGEDQQETYPWVLFFYKVLSMIGIAAIFAVKYNVQAPIWLWFICFIVAFLVGFFVDLIRDTAGGFYTDTPTPFLAIGLLEAAVWGITTGLGLTIISLIITTIYSLVT